MPRREIVLLFAHVKEICCVPAMRGFRGGAAKGKQGGKAE